MAAICPFDTHSTLSGLLIYSIAPVKHSRDVPFLRFKRIGRAGNCFAKLKIWKLPRLTVSRLNALSGAGTLGVGVT